MEQTGDKNGRLSEKEKAPLRSTIGQLSWIPNQTRLDISYDVCHLSMEARECDVTYGNKIISEE